MKKFHHSSIIIFFVTSSVSLISFVSLARLAMALLQSTMLISPISVKSKPYHYSISSFGFRRLNLNLNPRRQRDGAVVMATSGDVDAFTKYSGYLFEDGASSEAEFLEEYNLARIAAIYRRKPILVFRRFVQIGTTFGQWFASRYLDSLLERSDEMFKVLVLAISVFVLLFCLVIDVFRCLGSLICLQVRATELRRILIKLGPVIPCFLFCVKKITSLFCFWKNCSFW